MIKQDFLDRVSSKKGFVRIVKDELAQDSIKDDLLEKRVLTVETINTDGTGGIVYVYYLLNTSDQQATFYNVEPQNFDHQEMNADEKKLNALEKYLGGKYNAYFIDKIDLKNNWASAVVYSLNAGKLNKKSVLVFKQGTNPISDLDVI